MARPDPEIAALLYQALDEPIGIEVLSSDVHAGRQKLYATRRALQDPDLDVLQFRLSPDNPQQAIWIVKGAPK